MKTRSLACLLLLMSTAAQAEEFFPEPGLSLAEYKKAWRLMALADAHLALGEHREGIEAAKSAFRIVRDVRAFTYVAVLYEDWGSNVSDPKEAYRLHKQAAFFYERLERLLTTVPRGSPIGWVRRKLEERLPPLKEALAEMEEDAEEDSPSSGHTVTALETELARTRDELAKKQDELAQERATRAALEQALRALAAQKPLCPVCEVPIPVAARYAEAKLGK
jgi:tetratricopeptide (TPR) repeat protein